MPDFRHRLDMSMVTLGRLSYIAPITPRGTRFLPISKPLGKVRLSNTSPTGSGRAATVIVSRAIPSRRDAESISLSSMASLIPEAFAFS